MHHQWEYLTNEQINTAVYNQIRLSPTEVTCWKYSTTQCGKNSWIQIWSQREHYCEITNLRSASVLPIHSLLSMISETKCTLPDAQTTLKNLRSNWIRNSQDNHKLQQATVYPECYRTSTDVCQQGSVSCSSSVGVLVAVHVMVS